MKIIFLDIDGVLNSVDSIKINKADGKPTAFWDLPHKIHVDQLNRILDETNAHIVISSSWRHFHNVASISQLLFTCGVKKAVKVIDLTPVLRTPRGLEIQAWLDKDHSNLTRFSDFNDSIEIESFVILDDDADMEHLTDHLILTDSEKGLTEELAEEAIEKLNNI